MVFSALATPALVHRTSIRTALSIGGLGFSVYAASLANKSRGSNADWFIVFSAILCGLSAGILWAAEGAVALSYPERNKQGRYLSYWLSFRVLGQFIGGAILLGLNSKRSQAGTVSVETYWVFVALQALAPFVALLLSPPHKVQRTDKTPVYLHINSSLKDELKNMVKLLRSSKVLLLLPYMVSDADTSTSDSSSDTLPSYIRLKVHSARHSSGPTQSHTSRSGVELLARSCQR